MFLVVFIRCLVFLLFRPSFWFLPVLFRLKSVPLRRLFRLSLESGLLFCSLQFVPARLSFKSLLVPFRRLVFLFQSLQCVPAGLMLVPFRRLFRPSTRLILVPFRRLFRPSPKSRLSFKFLSFVFLVFGPFGF